MAARLPHTGELAGEANSILRREHLAVPCPRLPGAAGGIVGAAADHMVRALLDPRALPFRLAARGEAPVVRRAGLSLVGAIEERIRALAPWRRAPSGEARSELIPLCLALAHCEASYRSLQAHMHLQGRMAALRLDGLAAGARADRLVHALAGGPEQADLALLCPSLEALASRLRRLGGPRALNPDLALAAALGGADADLVLAGRLVELKTTSSTAIASRVVLWQLAGYLLADRDNTLAIREVAICAPRWDSEVVWGADELLVELSGTRRPLEVWRAEFAAIAARLGDRRVARRQAPGRPEIRAARRA